MKTGESKQVRSRYLVGIDGANSLIRSKIGSGRKDLGFEADWLVIDMLLKDGVTVEKLGIPECGQYCNPVRPTTIVPGGVENGRVCRRWEFMRLPSETKEEMETTEKVWELLGAWIKPDQADLVRHTVYSFRSLIADKWRDGRILLAGDAAHVMPPFMGQGMCAGMRDALNLTWKLDMVMKGLASDDLLDAYQPERAPHVSDIIGISIFLGQIICIPDPAEAAKRDEMFLSGNAPPMAPFPILTDGLLERDASGAPKGLAGRLAPHAIVGGERGEGRLDEIVGCNFNLILGPGRFARGSFTGGVGLYRGDRRSGGRNRRQGGAGHDRRRPWQVDGFLKGAGVGAILVRPDFLIYGAAADEAGVEDLVSNLRRDLAQYGVEPPEAWSAVREAASAAG